MDQDKKSRRRQPLGTSRRTRAPDDGMSAPRCCLARSFGYFLRALRLAVRTVASDFHPDEHDLEPEERFHLAPDSLEGLTEKRLDLAAT